MKKKMTRRRRRRMTRMRNRMMRKETGEFDVINNMARILLNIILYFTP